MRGASIDRGEVVLYAIIDTILNNKAIIDVTHSGNTLPYLRASFKFTSPKQKEAALQFTAAFISDIPASGDWHLRDRSKHFSHSRPFFVSADYAITFGFPRKRAIFQIKDLSFVMSDFDYNDNKDPVVWDLGTAGQYILPDMTPKDRIYRPQWPVSIDADNGISCIFKDISSNIDLNAVADDEGLSQLTFLLADVIQRNPVSAMAWFLQYYYIYPVSYIINTDKLDNGGVSVKKADFSNNIPQIQAVSKDKNKITIICSDGSVFGLRLYATGKTAHSLSRVTVDLWPKKEFHQEKKYLV